MLLQTYANVLCKIGPVNVCFAKVICKFAQMLDWQALRYVLAVGRHRALSEAAGRIGANHLIVLRRMLRIEGNLSTRMFEKHRDG